MTDEALAAWQARLADLHAAVSDPDNDWAWAYVGHVGPEPVEFVLTRQPVAVPRGHPARGKV